MEFYNNKKNENLKFKLNMEGINPHVIEARLIFKGSETLDHVVWGKIQDGICHFEIPELKLYEKNDRGTLKFEIVSEDLYFMVWKEDFEITTKATVKVEEMYQAVTNEEVKPKISVTATEIIKEKKSEPVKTTEPKAEVKPVKENKNTAKDSDKETLSFEQFFKKK
jgi:hypothetical protein